MGVFFQSQPISAITACPLEGLFLQKKKDTDERGVKIEIWLYFNYDKSLYFLELEVVFIL